MYPEGAAIGREAAARNSAGAVLAGSAKEVTIHEEARAAFSQIQNLVQRLEQFSSRCGTNDRNPVGGDKVCAPQPDSLKWTVVGISQAIGQAHSIMGDIERVA